MSGTPVPLLDLAREHRALEGEIRAAIEGVLARSAFVGGDEVRGFESEFGAYCGARHCIGVANGTDALVLALRALGIGPGDAVLTVPFTFLASVEAIDLAGGTPVFCDIDPDDYTIDIDSAEKIFRQRPIKAVIPVHLYGQPARMEELTALARRYGAAVVEDAAQAQGARLRLAGGWARAGALGDIACFSFYPTKNLGALGDAGAVTTNDDALAEKVRLLHDHGQAGKYRHILRAATNSRLDGIQAAVLRLKLTRLEATNARRRQLAAQYDEAFAGLSLTAPHTRANAEHVYHQYVVRFAARERVQASLAAEGVNTAIHYPLPVHLQEAYRSLGYGAGSFPVSERSSAEVLSLPLFPTLRAEEVERVVQAVRRAVG